MALNDGRQQDWSPQAPNATAPEITFTSTGHGIAEEAVKQRVNLVVLDVAMPSIAGMEALIRLAGTAEPVICPSWCSAN